VYPDYPLGDDWLYGLSDESHTRITADRKILYVTADANRLAWLEVVEKDLQVKQNLSSTPSSTTLGPNKSGTFPIWIDAEHSKSHFREIGLL
jgi:hypothetical protein